MANKFSLSLWYLRKLSIRFSGSLTLYDSILGIRYNFIFSRLKRSSKYSCSLEFLVEILSVFFWGWVSYHIVILKKCVRLCFIVPNTDENRLLILNCYIGYSLSELIKWIPQFHNRYQGTLHFAFLLLMWVTVAACSLTNLLYLAFRQVFPERLW